MECANNTCDDPAVINVTLFIGEDGVTRPLCEMHAVEMAISVTRNAPQFLQAPVNVLMFTSL